MGELRARREGLEIVLRFEDPADLTPDLHTAIEQLVRAMAAEADLPAPEVQGFALDLEGGFVPIDPVHPKSSKYGPRQPLSWGCWGFASGGGGYCTWYDGDAGDVQTCAIYTI